MQAAARLAEGVYEVHDLAAITPFDRFPGRDVLLWFDGEGAQAFDRVGTNLAESFDPDVRAVKFLTPAAVRTPFAPKDAESLGWTWEQTRAWALTRVKVWTNGAFMEAVREFQGTPEPEVFPEPPEGAASILEPPDAPEGAAEEALASLTDAPLPEPPPEDDALQQSSVSGISGVSSVFHVDGEPWPVPMDLWDGAHLPDVDHNWLPGPIADYTLDQAALIGCDPVQMALNCMTIAAACIDERIGLQMMADSPRWTERARLWGAVVGDPSSRKGPALDAATGWFQHLAHELRTRQEAEIAEYALQAKIHEKRMAAYIAEAAKNAVAVKPPAPEKPMSKRLWTDDPTKEAIAGLLSNHARGKILIIKDELASWFGSFDAYSNGKGEKDKPDWLSSYEGKERWIDRARDGGQAIHVPRWSVGILGGIQPSVLAAIALKLGHDGMLQRFQIVISKSSTEGEERKPDGAALARWQRVLSNLLDLCPSDYPVRFSPEAQAFRSECSRWISKAMRSGVSPSLVAALGKWEGLFGRLCITAHCIHAADAGRPFPDPVVPLDTARQCWRYIHEMLWPHALQFYENSFDEGPRAPLKWAAGLILVRGWREVTTTKMLHNWSGYRRLNTPAMRREFWDWFVTAGWLRPNGGFGGSSGPTRFSVNPAVHDGRFEAQRARYDAERARMEETRPKLRSAGED